MYATIALSWTVFPIFCCMARFVEVGNDPAHSVFPHEHHHNGNDLKHPEYNSLTALEYKKNPAPDGHRCGVCPTYFQKICAFDFLTNSTYIFDNHCIMDLYNCLNGNHFVPMNYERCLYFGNFAYVHGFKYEDLDYGEDDIIIHSSKKHPDFI